MRIELNAADAGQVLQQTLKSFESHDAEAAAFLHSILNPPDSRLPAPGNALPRLPGVDGLPVSDALGTPALGSPEQLLPGPAEWPLPAPDVLRPPERPLPGPDVLRPPERPFPGADALGSPKRPLPGPDVLGPPKRPLPGPDALGSGVQFGGPAGQQTVIGDDRAPSPPDRFGIRYNSAGGSAQGPGEAPDDPEVNDPAVRSIMDAAAFKLGLELSGHELQQLVDETRKDLGTKPPETPRQRAYQVMNDAIELWQALEKLAKDPNSTDGEVAEMAERARAADKAAINAFFALPDSESHSSVGVIWALSYAVDALDSAAARAAGAIAARS